VNHPDIAWALETDGTVHRFDRDKRIWTPSGDRWEDVLATGTAFLAQWGRPSGLQRLVLVFGSTEPSTHHPTVDPTHHAAVDSAQHPAHHAATIDRRRLVVGAVPLAVDGDGALDIRLFAVRGRDRRSR
jgi:hypothetical protein